MRELLLCPPDHYGIEYEINPWMDMSRQAEHAVAESQWHALRTNIIDAGAKKALSIRIEVPVEGLGEPVLAPGTGCLERRHPRGRQLDERPAPVAGVGPAGDEAGVLEVVHDLGHRLRPHALGGGEVADPRGPAAVEAAEHGQLAERGPGLGTQAPDDPADGLTELVRQRRGRHRFGRHGRSVESRQGDCTGNL